MLNAPGIKKKDAGWRQRLDRRSFKRDERHWFPSIARDFESPRSEMFLIVDVISSPFCVFCILFASLARGNRKDANVAGDSGHGEEGHGYSHCLRHDDTIVQP
jgi:hypothetical protein